MYCRSALIPRLQPHKRKKGGAFSSALREHCSAFSYLKFAVAERFEFIVRVQVVEVPRTHPPRFRTTATATNRFESFRNGLAVFVCFRLKRQYSWVTPRRRRRLCKYAVVMM